MPVSEIIAAEAFWLITSGVVSPVRPAGRPPSRPAKLVAKGRSKASRQKLYQILVRSAFLVGQVRRLAEHVCPTDCAKRASGPRSGFNAADSTTCRWHSMHLLNAFPRSSVVRALIRLYEVNVWAASVTSKRNRAGCGQWCS